MLAAVAASAVPGLEAISVAAAPYPADDLDVAVLGDRDGAHWTVQVPRTQQAQTRQAADVIALTALTPGARARLPFDVPTVAGQAPVRPTRAVVMSWCAGAPASLGSIPTEPNGLGWMIGRAIAAIHDLPSTVVTDAGLPVTGPAESRRWATSLAERAATDQVTRIARDLLGRPYKIIDAVGNYYGHDYDGIGRRVASHDPDLGSWHYGRDDDGRLVRQSDGRGVILELAYDVVGRPISQASDPKAAAEAMQNEIRDAISI